MLRGIQVREHGAPVDVSSIFDCEVVTSLDRFKQQSEIILTNRLDDALDGVKEKVFTRDIYGTN